MPHPSVAASPALPSLAPPQPHRGKGRLGHLGTLQREKPTSPPSIGHRDRLLALANLTTNCATVESSPCSCARYSQHCTFSSGCTNLVPITTRCDGPRMYYTFPRESGDAARRTARAVRFSFRPPNKVAPRKSSAWSTLVCRARRPLNRLAMLLAASPMHPSAAP